MSEIQVKVKDGYYWRHEGTPRQVARMLADRSFYVLLHVEPVEVKGDDEQNEIRRLYFMFGGKCEPSDVPDSLDWMAKNA